MSTTIYDIIKSRGYTVTTTAQEHIAVAEVLMQYATEFLSEGKTEEADEMMELAIERKKMADKEEKK